MSETIAKNKTTQKKNMEKYYARHAKIYDMSRWSFLFGRIDIIKHIPLLEFDPVHIVEIGCGTGYNLERLAKRFYKANITGIDVSKDMIQQASKRMEQQADRVQLINHPYGEGTLDELPAPDAILFSYALTMINPHWYELIMQAKKDLKPGGYIAFVDFHDSRFQWFKNHMGNNHVRMDGHILPVLQENFTEKTAKVKQAYAGVWEYVLFVGKKEA